MRFAGRLGPGPPTVCIELIIAAHSVCPLPRRKTSRDPGTPGARGEGTVRVWCLHLRPFDAIALVRRTVLQPGEALLEGGARLRQHVEVDHLGEIGRLRCR